MRTRVNDGGNYCGHNPDNPRIALTEPVSEGMGGVPKIITTLMERVVGYYHKPSSIPSLNLANQSNRQQRSERREACLSSLWAILKYCDLASLRVGVPSPDGFLSLTIGYLAKHTGLPKRRVERAIKDLKAAGLIGIHPRCEKQPDGTYKGIAAIKTVSPLLFAIFGLKYWLAFEKERAKNRLKKKLKKEAERTTITAQARRTQTAKAALQSLNKLVGNPSRRRKENDSSREQEEQIRRKTLELARQYYQSGVAPDRCVEEAEKVIRAQQDLYPQ